MDCSLQFVPMPSQKSSASPLDDEKAPQENSADQHTNDCSFCCCLIDADHYLSIAEVQRLVFHEKCGACSAPDGAQIPLCDFCKHLRLRHLIQCKNRFLDDMFLKRLSIALDPEARALGRTKCDLCDFLTNAMSLPQTGPSEVEIILTTSATLMIDRWSYGEIKGRRGSPTRNFSVCLEADFYQAPTNNWVNSEDFVQWDVIRRWLFECNENHKHPRAIHSRPTVPPGFRVIDVNRRCVVEREDFCEYMALSYVWGSRSESACYVEQATCDNIKSLCVPGGLTQLPETIEDAIAVCQKLGIKYLWVDRYCIVQDHAIHKHTQVAAMADIYSSSTITIIACSGKDGVESGIPGVRRKRQKRRRINIQGLALSYPSPHLDNIIPGSIWNTRGWTYQEAALSERRLIMTPTEVWIQCGINTFREYSQSCYKTNWTARIRIKPGVYFYDYSVFLDYAINLRMYTRRKLGYASDIYNAFDGIAQALYPRDNGFHFGLPELCFDQALLWYCGCRWNDSRSRRLRVCAETTPSWSWGSLTCGVVCNRFFCTTLVKWVLYKAQDSDMSSQIANTEAYGAHRIELKAMGEPILWQEWRLERLGPCPQLFVALAINEGCIKAEKVSIPAQKSFRSLEKHFTARWPTYKDAYNEVRQIDAREASGRNGVLFTKAQSTIFNIRSGWIQNTNGMVIGRVYQKKPAKLTKKAFHEVDRDPEEDGDDETCGNYEECNNYEECCDDGECNVEGIALSISEALETHIKHVVQLNNPEISLEGYDVWDELYRDLTYFDCNDRPLTPIPRVNVMFISWEDGYARRIGLGWIALKQWSLFDWELKDIWLK